MANRFSRVVHVTLMMWLTALFLFGWLPLLRSLMDGPSYQWGDSLFGVHLHGTGISGDLWYPVVKTAVGIALLWLGWRRPNGSFRAVGPLVLGILFLDALYNLLTAPEAARFEGATLGIEISIALLAPMLHGLFLALAVWWAIKSPALRPHPLNAVNVTLIGTALLLLPFQYMLLRSGQGQDFNDVAGVLMTIGGWFLLSLGFAPWGAWSGSGRQLAAA